MTITPLRMSEIMKARRLSVQPSRDGGWRVRTAKGSRAAPATTSYPTPEDAVEAAEAHLAAGDRRTDGERALLVVNALRRGRYYLRQRLETVDGATKQLWDGYDNADGGLVEEVTPREDYAAMVAALEKHFDSLPAAPEANEVHVPEVPGKGAR